MRSRRRIVALLAICATVLIYSSSVLVQPAEQAIAGNFEKNSWFFDFHVIHEPSVSHEDRPVLIVVTSAPQNQKKRNAIRKTWGSWPHARVLYLMGFSANHSTELQKTVESEVSTYGDVVQMDFVDSYRNLTLKSCALVIWAAQNFWPNRGLVIKVDDDTCVDMPLLTLVLGDFRDGIYGEFRNATKPLRCKRSACNKWGLTTEEYAQSTFPPHVQGAFYVISESVLGRIRSNLFVPQFLFIEDVYITGLVARAANVPVRPMPKRARVDPMVPSKTWFRQKNILAQHRCNEKFQNKFWTNAMRRTL